MECENHVPDRKDGASSSGNDPLQACTAGDQWDKVDTGQKQIPTGELDNYSLDMTETMPPQKRGSIHATKGGTEDIDM